MSDEGEKTQPPQEGEKATGPPRRPKCRDDDNPRFETAPFDPRFPNQNQTKYCYVSFLDYHRCLKANEAPCHNQNDCEVFKKIYKSICPNAWVAKWNEQIQNGTFAGNI